MSLFLLHLFYYYLMNGEELVMKYCRKRMYTIFLSGVLAIPAFYAHSITENMDGNNFEAKQMMLVRKVVRAFGVFFSAGGFFLSSHVSCTINLISGDHFTGYIQ